MSADQVFSLKKHCILPTTDFAYRNITISGLPGCGSTSLANSLRKILGEVGWTGFNGGEFMRAYAVEKGYFRADDTKHHSSSCYPDDFDREVDFGMRKKLETENHWLLESWLSGFVAQGVEKVLKILMICSDDAVRIDRIINRDHISVEEAKNNVYSRYENNLKNWSEIYEKEWQEWVVNQGVMSANEKIDFWDPRLYNLVIDTYSAGPEETVELAMNKLIQG